MSYSEKFYYIDENGNKKKYVGKVIYNSDGAYTGILNKNTKSICSKELIYHPEVAAVEGHFTYYSYVTNEGEEIRYFDNIKKDEEGNPYFTYVERNMFNLDYNPEVKESEGYFTYIDPDTQKECVYEGSVIYNKKNNTYTGIIKK